VSQSVFRLELGSFPVNDIVLSDEFSWRDGELAIDRDELLGLVLQDQRVEWASVDVARPGDSARIVNVYDVWMPMVKVEGAGETYPAIAGRDTNSVGQGRTHRMTGIGVIECSSTAPLMAREVRLVPNSVERGNFFDMSGPRSKFAYGRLNNVCLAMERAEGVSDEDWEACRAAASLRVCDRLTETVRGLEPPEFEIFDTSRREPGLPGVIHVPLLVSRESFRGPRTCIGPAVYGLTRQSMPWLLHATEVMDGAITRGESWYQANNPNVFELVRRHGVDWNCLGVIVGRTNWTSMAEKDVFAHRIAELARALGASGAVVTVDIRGARFVETVLAVQALERVGVKTVLMTLEETAEDGQAPPLLMSVPELVSVVSCGDGAVPGPFPAVERVFGAREPTSVDAGEHPGVKGGYGQARFWIDYYGLDRHSGIDF
jgi:glycine reductase